jgi:RND family efflux transporter MFP subunit
VMENVDSKGNVVAPAAGKILSLNAAKNSYVGPTAPVAVIDSAPRLEISVMVSESLVPRLSLQDEADVTISALDLTVTGLIQEIDEKANPQTKLYTVTLWTQEEVEGLRAGMFADVTFRTDVSTDTIVIPTEAILTTSEGQNVFVVEDGKARYVPVVTGLTGNGVTEIAEGLSAGDQLVVVGQSYLTDGDPVRIVSGED